MGELPSTRPSILKHCINQWLMGSPSLLIGQFVKKLNRVSSVQLRRSVRASTVLNHQPNESICYWCPDKTSHLATVKATKDEQTIVGAPDNAVRYLDVTSLLTTAKYCLSRSDMAHSATTKDRVSWTRGLMRSDSYWAVTKSATSLEEDCKEQLSDISDLTSARQSSTTPNTLADSQRTSQWRHNCITRCFIKKGSLWAL